MAEKSKHREFAELILLAAGLWALTAAIAISWTKYFECHVAATGFEQSSKLFFMVGSLIGFIIVGYLALWITFETARFISGAFYEDEDGHVTQDAKAYFFFVLFMVGLSTSATVGISSLGNFNIADGIECAAPPNQET